MDIQIEKLKKIKDERGIIIEILNSEFFVNKKIGHLFLATFEKEKSIRGNHYHTYQNEFYTIIEGNIEVILKDIKTNEEKRIKLSSDEDEIITLRIGPNIAHACYNLTPKAVLLAYFSHPYNEKATDTIKYKLI